MRDSVAIIDADGKILKRSSAVLPIYSITKLTGEPLTMALA